MKPQRFFIHFISHIIRRRFRSDWKREWEAELTHRKSRLQQWRQSARKARWDLLRRSLASFWDALAMQPRRLEDDMVQECGLPSYRGELFTLVTAEGAQQIAGMRVSADFFPALGVEAFRGRIFVSWFSVAIAFVTAIGAGAPPRNSFDPDRFTKRT